MRQAIELSKLPLCDAPRLPWLARLRAKLFGPPAARGTARLDRLSVHVLRDIGLSDGPGSNPGSNPLLKDQNLFRR